MKKLFGLLFLVGFVFGAELEVVYEERVPYVAKDGDAIKGIVATPLLEALKKSGVSYELKEKPSKRHLHEIQTNTTKVCAVGWFKNPEREAFAKFTKPIYTDKPMGIIARSNELRFDDGVTLETLLGSKELVLLTKASYSYGKVVDEKILSLAPNKKEVSADNQTMLEMVKKKRGDYYFISFEEAEEFVLKSGESKDLKFISPKGMPDGSSRYLICSKIVDDGIIEKINKHLK